MIWWWWVLIGGLYIAAISAVVWYIRRDDKDPLDYEFPWDDESN